MCRASFEVPLLLTNGGIWNGTRVSSREYIAMLQTPADADGCHSLLFWVNSGDTCTRRNAASERTVEHRMITSAPSDLYSMNAMMAQNVLGKPQAAVEVRCQGVRPAGGASRRTINPIIAHLIMASLVSGRRS